MIAKTTQGYNLSIFAYGMTSSGKTHTMHGQIKNLNFDFAGNPIFENLDLGVIPLVAAELFKNAKEIEN
jgi:hypothetical protein